MQKISTLFKREGRPFLAIDEAEDGCYWALLGGGRATVKIDGTCCAAIDGAFYRRHRHKEEKGDPPTNWLHWTLDPDQRSGHGWIPVHSDDPSSRYHIEAMRSEPRPPEDGTFELVGPKIQKNPYGYTTHVLERHGEQDAVEVPTYFAGIRAWLEDNAVEGVVWHHPDGRMAKIKRVDFGIPWPANA